MISRKPVRQTQAQGDLVVFEGDRVDEAQIEGTWIKGTPVEARR